ncbi:hypothetical protein GYMLUDRAFT_56771 [Collybiopsis luxurians FD-317 M1]|nr:hypothetical protein GYMLUDRAFT_56771 [Collybiopsis luxurians FD-317 M1]
MRRELAQALKKQSKSIETALNDYNNAASSMNPPRPILNWEEVVDHSFLSEFDILRDTCEDIRQRPWAQPATRTLITQFFKTIRAEEELHCVHQEIRRLYSFMRQETQELIEKEMELKNHPELALQVRKYRLECGQANEQHRR